MKNIKKILFILLAFSFILVHPVLSYAQISDPDTGEVSGGIVNPVIGDLGGNQPGGIDQASEGSTFLKYFVILWQTFINVGGLAVIIMFLWGAIEWIVAGGDSGKVQKARDRITQSIIGLVLLVGSFVVISYIGKIFFGGQFDLLRFTLPTI